MEGSGRSFVCRSLDTIQDMCVTVIESVPRNDSFHIRKTMYPLLKYKCSQT